MCLDPISAVGIGLSLAGSATSTIAQSQAASAQQTVANQTAAANQELTFQSNAQQFMALGQQLQQQRTQAAVQTRNIQRDAMMARSRVTAAAAEGGVQGQSVDALLADYSRQESEYRDATDLQLQLAEQENLNQGRGVILNTKGRLISSRPDMFQGPNFLSSTIGAFGSALGTGLSIENTMRKMPETP